MNVSRGERLVRYRHTSLVRPDRVAEDALERARAKDEVRALHGRAEGGDPSRCSEVGRRAAHDERQVRRPERVGQGRAGVRRVE